PRRRFASARHGSRRWSRHHMWPLHRQRSRRDTSPLADQPQARRDPRLLGLAVPPLPSGRATGDALWRSRAVARDGERTVRPRSRRRRARGGGIARGDQGDHRALILTAARPSPLVTSLSENGTSKLHRFARLAVFPAMYSTCLFCNSSLGTNDQI